jgi:hypothetical protein
VPSGALAKVKVAVLVAAKGLKNSSLIETCEGGTLCSIVMRPSRTSLLPVHA